MKSSIKAMVTSAISTLIRPVHNLPAAFRAIFRFWSNFFSVANPFDFEEHFPCWTKFLSHLVDFVSQPNRRYPLMSSPQHTVSSFWIYSLTFVFWNVKRVVELKLGGCWTSGCTSNGVAPATALVVPKYIGCWEPQTRLIFVKSCLDKHGS